LQQQSAAQRQKRHGGTHRGPAHAAFAGAKANHQSSEEGDEGGLENHQRSAAERLIQSIGDQVIQPGMGDPQAGIRPKGIALKTVTPLDDRAAGGQVQPQVAVAGGRGGEQKGE
jgi:hypothetical protein